MGVELRDSTSVLPPPRPKQSLAERRSRAELQIQRIAAACGLRVEIEVDDSFKEEGQVVASAAAQPRAAEPQPATPDKPEKKSVPQWLLDSMGEHAPKLIAQANAPRRQSFLSQSEPEQEPLGLAKPTQPMQRAALRRQLGNRNGLQGQA